MSAIDQFAFSLNRQDEVPNQELARELAANEDREEIREIADYLHKNNRMVWGGLIALAALVKLKADQIYPHAAEMVQFMQTGSVICVDNAVKILAGLCAANHVYQRALFHYLIEHLQACRPIDVARRAEYSLIALTPENHSELKSVLQQRLPDLTSAQAARARKVLRTLVERSAA